LHVLIAIIETGAPPASLAERYGSYADMFERMLSPLSPALTFTRVRIFEGEAFPALSAIDGALITGSAAGVYEDHPWIAPLEEFIRSAASAGKPQVGICFGHQAMAQAFGGRVEKSQKGWGVGVHDYAVVGGADWMEPALNRVASVVSHQDQVIEAPNGSRCLIESKFCELAALSYAQGPAISFQMHPEFEHDFAADLLRAREERLPKPVVDEGLSTLKQPTDRAAIARWIANFYLENAQ
jgi:GMP synthase-like glutamine amidotransferase